MHLCLWVHLKRILRLCSYIWDWVNDLYNDLLVKTAAARKVDTATLRKLAADASIRTAGDAVAQHLIDAVKYDDEE